MVNSTSDDMYPRPPEADLAYAGPEAPVPYDRTPEPDEPQPLSWWVDLASTLDLAAWPHPDEPPGAVDFRLTLDVIGVRSWDITSGDTAAYGPTDGLQITRSVPETDLTPMQPAPAVARFGLIMETIADVALDIGQPVAIKFYSPADAAEPVEQFHGRITDLVISPHSKGVLYDVTCVDYLADLHEIFIEYGVVTASTSAEQLQDIFDAAGLPWPAALPPPAPYAAETYTGNPSVTVPTDTFYAGDQIDQLLVQWMLTFFGGTAEEISGRFIIEPNIAGDVLDPAQPYRLRILMGVAEESGVVIPASQVDLGGAFTRRKYAAVNRVHVTYAGSGIITYQIGPADPAVIGELSTTLAATSVIPPSNAAMFYYPADSEAGRWTADAFTWRLKAAEPGDYLPQLLTYVTVAGIDPRWSPVGPNYRGVLSAYTLTIERARPTLTFELRDAVEPTP